jgi:hypothetical protein
MPKRTITLGDWSVTSYKRSDKCELVYVPLAFNILDDEQRKDLLFVLSAPNRAGRVRECVRMIRTGAMASYSVPMPLEMESLDDAESITDDDILDGLL